MKIIITGATGFLGRNFAESFHDKGVEVIRLIIEVSYNLGESVNRYARSLFRPWMTLQRL
jgi:nucleoside-diphosphate-sugar epimerase